MLNRVLLTRFHSLTVSKKALKQFRARENLVDFWINGKLNDFISRESNNEAKSVSKSCSIIRTSQ